MDKLSKLKELEQAMPLKEWQLASDAILLHTRGKGIEKLLQEFRPNEPQEIRDYRVKQLFKYTRQPFSKSIDAITKALTQVGIDWSIQNDVEIGNIKTNLGAFTLEKYLINLFQIIVEYPNAHLVWLPVNPNENPDYYPLNHPLGVSADSSKLEVEPYIAKNVRYFDESSCIWEHGKWSFSSDGKDYTYPYYMGCDKTGFYRSIPIGFKNAQVVYSIEPYYTPNGGFRQRPTRPLGGDLTSVDKGGIDKPYYVSYFANAAEFGRDFISSYSDFKGNMFKNSYPIREIADTTCDSCNGSGHPMNNAEIACVDCGGTGKLFTTSPYGDIMRKPLSTREKEAGVKREPLITYYHDGRELLDFGLNYCFETLYVRIEDALCLNYVRTAQSGTAKEEDKESYYSLMTKLVENYLELLKFSLVSIIDIKVYDPKERKDVEVWATRSVRSANTFDLISEISSLSASNLPTSIKASITKQYLVDIKDEVEAKIMNIIVDYDVLFGKNEAEILQLSAAVNSPINRNDMEFNLRGRGVLMNLSKKYKDFLTKSNEELYNEAKNILSPQKDGALDVLDIDKVDVEAEAKAKLKGTVGGIQGIIQINQAVSRKEMTEASAERLLMEIYGFDKDTANALIEIIPNENSQT